MKQAEEYYYGRMPKDKQNTYCAMLAGLMNLSDEILLPQVPTTDEKRHQIPPYLEHCPH